MTIDEIKTQLTKFNAPADVLAAVSGTCEELKPGETRGIASGAGVAWIARGDKGWIVSCAEWPPAASATPPTIAPIAPAGFAPVTTLPTPN